jgi:hypothetical protein
VLSSKVGRSLVGETERRETMTAQLGSILSTRLQAAFMCVNSLLNILFHHQILCPTLPVHSTRSYSHFLLHTLYAMCLLDQRNSTCAKAACRILVKLNPVVQRQQVHGNLSLGIDEVQLDHKPHLWPLIWPLIWVTL